MSKKLKEEVATEPSFMTDLRRMFGKPTPKAKVVAAFDKIIRATLASMNVEKFERKATSRKISTKSPGFSKKILGVVQKYGSEQDIMRYKTRGFASIETDKGFVSVRVFYEMDKITMFSISWQD